MTNKLKSRICFIASLITSVGIPITVILVKYKVITVISQQTTKVKLSILFALIILILLIVFFKRILKYLSSFEYSYTIMFVKGVLKLIPLICLLLVLNNIILIIKDLTFITSWIVGCNAVTFFVLDPLTSKFILQHKKDIQRQIVKEAINNE